MLGAATVKTEKGRFCEVDGPSCLGMLEGPCEQHINHRNAKATRSAHEKRTSTKKQKCGA